MKIPSCKYLVSNLAVYFIFFLSVIAVSTGAFAAANPEKAKAFIQGVGDKVIAVVSADKIGSDSKEKQLDALFVETVDIDWIAKFVVGKAWRESTPEQQQQYMKLYHNFLVNSYVPKFRQYTGQKMVINKSVAESETEYLIETTINDQEGHSYSVSYKARDAGNGKFKIYDIIAEGVSMITTQRSEFASILSREGMDALIKKLENKG